MSSADAIAIIGGTGFGAHPVLSDAAPTTVQTPFGPVAVVRGHLGAAPAVLLRRHGDGHSLAPHEVDYRANIAALIALGVRRVLATNAVGSLRRDLPPGTLVLLDDFIDLTRSRALSYFGDVIPRPPGVMHTDLSVPYCPSLRGAVIGAAERTGIAVEPRGTYVCVDGPRYESPAEVRLMSSWGADVVGMTGLPEAVFAREAGLCYAAVCIVTNPGAGLAPGGIAHGAVSAGVQAAAPTVVRLFAEAAALPLTACRCAAV